MQTHGQRILRKPEMLNKVGLSAPDLYRRIAAGTFPKGIPLGEKSIGWLESEVDAWIAQRVAERDAPTRQTTNIGKKLAAAKKAKRLALEVA